MFNFIFCCLFAILPTNPTINTIETGMWEWQEWEEGLFNTVEWHTVIITEDKKGYYLTDELTFSIYFNFINNKAIVDYWGAKIYLFRKNNKEIYGYINYGRQDYSHETSSFAYITIQKN